MSVVIALGVDMVDVGRFTHFYAYSQKQLLRIFSPDEITYCLQEPSKSAERFAVRFAAKEALYKALSQSKILDCSFLTLCQCVEIVLCPFPQIRQRVFFIDDDLLLLLSLSHSSTIGIATVLIQKIK